MDSFEDLSEPEAPTPRTRPRRARRNLAWFWNLLTAIVLVAAAVVLTAVSLIYQNPASSFYPFPRPTLIPTLFIPTRVIPTATLTPTALQPTATVQPTQTPQPTPTAIPATPAGITPTPAATGTLPVTSLYSFVIQAEPRAIDSTLFNSARGCKWMGVAGQVFDLRNSPVPLGIIIQVGGLVDGKVINITSLTGTATQYGPAGYEVTLADKPVATQGALFIRLLDQAGLAISDRIVFNTFGDCNQNLIIINFKQVK
jgi:hypothetical protein